MRDDFRTLNEKIAKDSKAVEEALKDLRADIAQVDKQMTLDRTEVVKLSAMVSGILEGQEGKWTEVVKKHVDKSLESVSENIEEVQQNLHDTRADAEELRDKENRRNNIILYNVVESNQERAEERNEDDAVFCLQLFNSMHVGACEEDMVRVF